MQIKSQRDFIAGLLFVAVGVAFAIGATAYPWGSTADPGAGFFPLILGVVLALLGAAVLFTSLTIETEGGDPVGAVAWRALFVIVGAVAVFGATIDTLGLAIAVPLVVVLASVAGGDAPWRGVLATALVLTLLSWLLFVVGLKLSIPLWPPRWPLWGAG